jgi:sugar phosphate isomerase/epimerase
MKLAVSTYSLWRWRRENQKTPDEALQWIAQSGASAVEFVGLEELPGEDLVAKATHWKKRATELGLAVAGFCVGAELLVNEQLQRQAIDQLKRQVDAAAALGVRSMRHDVTAGWSERNEDVKGPRTFAHALKVLAPALREVTEHGQKVGVITTLENHGFFMQESRRVERLIKAVNHKNYRLTLDVGNFLCVNENPTLAVKRLAKYAVMVHAKDFHVRKKTNVPATGWFKTPTAVALRGAIAGHGTVDLPAVLKLIKAAKYTGFLSLEFEGMEDPAVAVKLGLEYLKRELEAINAWG